MRLLLDDQAEFLTEARDVLRAGLRTAGWITVDDTGARHKANNGFCTQIGNDRFAWFGTTKSKSRLNFLDLLRAGYTDYVVNDAALSYMRERALSGSIIALLAQHPDKQFADPQAWQAHLQRLGITELSVTADPLQIATEGALWGSIQSHDFLRDAVIVSDDAGQFAVGQHALCRVGGDVAIPTPHSPGRAEFPHQMWPATFNAEEPQALKQEIEPPAPSGMVNVSNSFAPSRQRQAGQNRSGRVAWRRQALALPDRETE
jgi:hypothetical protein